MYRKFIDEHTFATGWTWAEAWDGLKSRFAQWFGQLMQQQ